MAQELTCSGSLAYAKGNILSVSMAKSGARYNVAGNNYARSTQLIGTSPEAIDLGEIVTPGWFFIQNNDATNFVDILDAVAGDALLRLKPGEFAIGRFAAAAPAAQADTSSVSIEYMIIEA